jgi:murein DD-endopeptidase MepM/ murein hydrolase activator NlpD
VQNSLDNLGKSIQQLLDKLAMIDRAVKGLGTVPGGGAGGSSGTGGVGSGGGNSLSGSLARVPELQSKGMFALSMAGTALKTVGGVAAGMSGMMPNSLSVVSREQGIYGAGVSMGGMVRRDMFESQVRRGLGNRQIIDNATAVVGSILTGSGIAPTSAKFDEITRGAGGAARLLNMQEDVSARAMAGLTSGRGAAMMLQNYGIFTADPTSGQMKSQNQIFGELATRFTQGNINNMTTEELMTDIYRGALGSNIRNSGMDEAQQELFKTFLMARTQGVNLDLSDSKSVAAYGRQLEAQGYENPLKAFQELTAKDDALAERATKPYIEGIQDATGALLSLKEAVEAMPDSLYRMKAAVDTFTGESAGQGVLAAGGSLVSGLVAGGTALAARNILMGGAASGAAATAGAVAKTAGGALLRVAGPVGGALGIASSAGSAFNKGRSGDSGGLMDYAGAAASGALLGATIGTLVPIPGVATAVGAGIGAIAGLGIAAGSNLLGRSMGEGGGTDGGGAGTMGQQGGQTEAFWLQHPTRTARITARFGQRESSFTPGKITWPSGHKGVDYAGSQGDLIHAAAPGTATVASSGALGTYVRIQHDNGMYTFYAHLSGVIIRNGQKVDRGQSIGKMGNTGSRSFGVHLHFALSKTDTTAGAIDPEPFLRGGANYLSPPTSEAEQAAAGNTPGPLGNSTTDAARGGEDTSAPDLTVSASGLSGSSEGIQVSSPGNSGSTGAEGPKAWSSSSWALAGGQGGGAAEGGEGASDAPGYLPTQTFGKGLRGKAAGSSTTNNVTINLSIASASEEEAKKFALLVKEKLEDDRLVARMGSR